MVFACLQRLVCLDDEVHMIGQVGEIKASEVTNDFAIDFQLIPFKEDAALQDFKETQVSNVIDR